MPNMIPQYIKEAEIQDINIKFKWDDWEVEDAYEPLDEDLTKRLAGLSGRTNIALSTASAEWIIHRFGLLLNDPIPLKYTEASWASIVNWRYTKYYEPPDRNWLGPVRGPVSLAIILVVDTIVRTVEEDVPSIGTASISNLTEHVLPNPTPFNEWRDNILKRLETFYTYKPDDPLGEVLPKQALDPSFDFDPLMTEDLINNFLKKLDYTENPFLRSPKEMLKLNFKGAPYIFDINEDRKQRRTL